MPGLLTLSSAGSEADGRSHAALELLAARAATGDRAAFERIYCLLADDLYTYVRAQCQNDTVAEDLIANVFLKAWRSITRYRGGPDRFRRWMFAIARNEVRDYWRNNRRTFPIADMDFVDSTAYETEPPNLDARRLLSQALASLTDDQRQVVVLRYFNGKSHAEIALLMGKREGSVRALLLRALRRMRKVMADVAA